MSKSIVTKDGYLFVGSVGELREMIRVRKESEKI